jgi:hypothetical protein
MKKGSKENRPPPESEQLEQPTEVAGMAIAAQVEYLAGLQFSRAEAARVVEQPITGDLEKAYERGRLLEEAKVREAIKRLAIRGSSPAQKQYQQMAEENAKNNARLMVAQKRKALDE